MNSIIRYFDLASAYRHRGAGVVNSPGNGGIPKTWPQWVALFLGVFVQPYYKTFLDVHKWYSTVVWEWLIVSAVISFVLFPLVYKNTLDPTKPLFVQLCLIFTGGLGWQSIIGTAIDAVAHAATTNAHP